MDLQLIDRVRQNHTNKVAIMPQSIKLETTSYVESIFLNLSLFCVICHYLRQLRQMKLTTHTHIFNVETKPPALSPACVDHVP